MEIGTIVLMLAVWISNVSGSSYLITAPRTVIRGADYGVTVDVLNTSGVIVTADLISQVYNYTFRRYDVHTLKSVQSTFDQGKTGLMTIPIEDTFSCQNCRLHIRGKKNLQFERSMSVTVDRKLVTVLIQTDKAIYKPGQRVRFRALAVYPDLKVYTGKFHIEIKDPRNNKIKVMSAVSGNAGVFEGKLDLSEQPPFGDWSIRVSLQTNSDTSTQTFTVADYDLPRFEVTVELPPYKMLQDTTLSGTIKAKYTFGEPVKGMVELHVGPDRDPDSCGHYPPAVQSAFKIDGEAKFSVPVSDLQRVMNIYSQSTVRVTAIVKEATTGIRLNGTSTVVFYRNEYSISFLSNTPSVFKPGLPYTAYVKVETPDNRPPTADKLDQVAIHAVASYRVTAKDQNLYGTSYFTGSYPLPGYSVPLPSNGVLPILLDIPHNATSITINIHYKGQRSSKRVSKSYSESSNYMQLSLESQNLKAGDIAKCKLLATEPLHSVSMLISSRGGVVSSFNLDGQSNRTVTFDLPVTSNMAPTAHLLAYYKRMSTEIVADSIAFNIDGIFKNKVSLAYNVDKSEPNKEVDLTVNADPNSTVNLLAVDQSVLLLKSGNDITTEKVNDGISGYDSSPKPSSSEFALSYSATNALDVFNQMELLVLTDIPQTGGGGSGGGGGALPGFYPTPAPGQPIYPSAPVPAAGGAFRPDADSSNNPAGGPLKQVEHIRKIFPEAWLWESRNISSSGKTTVKTIVPDTITSWVTSAFATNDLSGLGVAPTAAKLTVFRPFFVSLTYPSSVTRNEQAVIQVTVFNYLQMDTSIVVTLKGSTFYQRVLIASNGTESLLSGNQQQTVQVASGKQGVVLFPILAAQIGVVDIEVTAQTTVAADGVVRQMVIEAEGAPVSFNSPIFVNLDGSRSYNDKLSFPLPTSVVTGSNKMRVKVSGDLLGPSLDNIESLLALPTGCGEQSMVKFAPDLYIAQYLKSSGQLTDYWKQRITRFLNAGYQRELTYQRYDGGFSAFGNSDEAGSTWLTAFVSRTFHEAKDFIYVDPSLLTKVVNWMIDRQNKDGSFSEFGRVLDQNTQGSHSGPALTAYVLLALIENTDASTTQNCQLYKKNCPYVYKLGNATNMAIHNLESAIDTVKDDFTLAIISYALTKGGSASADKAFQRLQQHAHDVGGLQYWTGTAQQLPGTSPRPVPYGGSRYSGTWQPQKAQARPVDILTTAYGLLSYASRGQLAQGTRALSWLAKQRSGRGGFASTQDTTVALQALATYSMSSRTSNTNLKVKVTGDSNEILDFSITKTNALALQTKEYKSTHTNVDLDINGTGLAIVEIDQSFNVLDELSTPSFDVSTVLLDDDLDSFNLMICSKWLWDRKTGMVVQEIGIPSGFNPDLSTLGNVVGMKRSERKGNTVAIYFDEIGKTSTCYSLVMTRTSKVARSQKSFIRTYDYYEPADQSTVFYQPRKLRDSTICDVCKDCCAWDQITLKA